MARPVTVLVVDDDAGMRLTLQRILEGEGYDVLVAAHGPAALGTAAASPFDVAFVDYRMVGMNGGQVCAQLRRLQPEAAVYLVTAHVSSEAADAALAGGASGILYKPLDVDKLLQLIAARAENGPQPVPVALDGGQ